MTKLNAYLLILMTTLLLCACQRASVHPALASVPNKMLWAWERKEDLRWLPPDAGVAFVSTTITLDGDQFGISPRANPMLVSATTFLIPVVHVDASWRAPPSLSAAQHAAVVNQVILAAATQSAGRATGKVVQLDFEVRHSQRAFLMGVVNDIRRRLPADTALSVTALASWCAGDYWLAPMAADEIVPMVFRMGRDQQIIRDQLARQGHFPHAHCGRAIGVATDEAVVKNAATRQYYFSPVPWTPETWHRVSEPQ